MCMSGGNGLSQTITDPGPGPLGWTESGFPAGTQWGFDNNYSQRGQPGDTALSGGSRDSLYIEVPCQRHEDSTFNATLTDSLHRTYTFTVHVMDG